MGYFGLLVGRCGYCCGALQGSFSSLFAFPSDSQLSVRKSTVSRVHRGYLQHSSWLLLFLCHIESGSSLSIQCPSVADEQNSPICQKRSLTFDRDVFRRLRLVYYLILSAVHIPNLVLFDNCEHSYHALPNLTAQTSPDEVARRGRFSWSICARRCSLLCGFYLLRHVSRYDM